MRRPLPYDRMGTIAATRVMTGLETNPARSIA